MKSIVFGLSLASAAVAQIANGVSMVSVTAAASAAPSAANNGGASGSGSAAPSQITAAPSSSADSFYEQMPYSSYMGGGYQSLNCGYGYSKQSDGSCQSESWVRLLS